MKSIRNGTRWVWAGMGTFLAVLMLFFLFAISGCGNSATPPNSSPPSVSDASAPKASNSSTSVSTSSGYTKKDIEKLQNTENFARGALAHIFDGTINNKGKATGYHYSMVKDSKGHILDGTRSAVDAHGVFTAKVEVENVKKNGFSSFYPESWSPQEVVDAINTAYKDALDNPVNPHGNLWIGYHGDLEIDMYLNDKKKIVTAYPIYLEKER